jgi:hypothetical protein
VIPLLDYRDGDGHDLPPKARVDLHELVTLGLLDAVELHAWCPTCRRPRCFVRPGLTLPPGTESARIDG